VKEVKLLAVSQFVEEAGGSGSFGEGAEGREGICVLPFNCSANEMARS